MRRTSLILLIISVCAARAYGDFYPIAVIGGCGNISPPFARWREYADEKNATRFNPANVDNVSVVSQDLRVVFRAPGTIEVGSDYVLEVTEDNVTVDVQYMFFASDYFAEGQRFFISGSKDFEIKLGGRRVKPDKISYFGVDPEPGVGGEYTAVFPFKFGRAGRYKVKLSYSQDVPGGFLGVKDAAYSRGNLYGFSYDISPLRYWAGGVEEVRVELVLDGFDITDFGLISPSDFVFTENGCRWEWRDLTDEVLSYDYRIALYFGRAGGLGGDFTEVLREGGMEVYDGAYHDAKVIRKLEQGERVYLYRDPNDESISGPMYERGWRKCRFLDNTEGYVITWLPEYFFDSFERRKMMGSYPTIYREDNAR